MPADKIKSVRELLSNEWRVPPTDESIEANVLARAHNAEIDLLRSSVIELLDDMERLTGQLDVVRAERDAARRDLEALRSALKPSARLGAMGTAQVEADLVVYGLEERIIAIVVDLVANQSPPAVVLADDPLAQLVNELEAARAAAAQIGGGS